MEPAEHFITSSVDDDLREVLVVIIDTFLAIDIGFDYLPAEPILLEPVSE